MSASTDQVYDFVFKGLLAEEALDRAGRTPPNLSQMDDLELAKSLSIPSLDEENVANARKMALVYVAIAAFENSVRSLIRKVLLDTVGAEWWKTAVSEKIRSRAEQRMEEEQKVKWHTPRGDDPINFTSLPDLANIIRQNSGGFEPYVHSAEWASSIFDVLERSRNVIMHSGIIDPEDIERVGINIRDWIKQVGA